MAGRVASGAGEPRLRIELFDRSAGGVLRALAVLDVADTQDEHLGGATSPNDG